MHGLRCHPSPLHSLHTAVSVTDADWRSATGIAPVHAADRATANNTAMGEKLLLTADITIRRAGGSRSHSSRSANWSIAAGDKKEAEMQFRIVLVACYGAIASGVRHKNDRRLTNDETSYPGPPPPYYPQPGGSALVTITPGNGPLQPLAAGPGDQWLSQYQPHTQVAVASGAAPSEALAMVTFVLVLLSMFLNLWQTKDTIDSHRSNVGKVQFSNRMKELNEIFKTHQRTTIPLTDFADAVESLGISKQAVEKATPRKDGQVDTKALVTIMEALLKGETIPGADGKPMKMKQLIEHVKSKISDILSNGAVGQKDQKELQQAQAGLDGKTD